MTEEKTGIGAFGTRKDVNREPALTPAEMRAKYGEKK